MQGNKAPFFVKVYVNNKFHGTISTNAERDELDDKKLRHEFGDDPKIVYFVGDDELTKDEVYSLLRHM